MAIFKNAKIGKHEDVVVIEFGTGDIGVSNGHSNEDEAVKTLVLYQDVPKSVEEYNKEMPVPDGNSDGLDNLAVLLKFNRPESIDVVIDRLQRCREELTGKAITRVKPIDEKEMLEMMHEMCIESLDPDNFRHWESVKEGLESVRKDLRTNANGSGFTDSESELLVTAGVPVERHEELYPHVLGFRKWQGGSMTQSINTITRSLNSFSKFTTN